MQGIQTLGNIPDIGAKLASMGRYDDDQIAHVAEGEVIVPAPILKYYPEIKQQVFSAIENEGLDPNEFIVGGDMVARNPYTGIQEFGFFSKVFKSVKKIVKKAAPLILAVALPGIGTAMAGMSGIAGSIGGFLSGLGTVGTGALAGGLGGLIQGRNLKDSLKMAGIGALAAGAFQGISNAAAGRPLTQNMFGAPQAAGAGAQTAGAVKNAAADYSASAVGSGGEFGGLNPSGGQIPGAAVGGGGTTIPSYVEAAPAGAGSFGFAGGSGGEFGGLSSSGGQPGIFTNLADKGIFQATTDALGQAGSNWMQNFSNAPLSTLGQTAVYASILSPLLDPSALDPEIQNEAGVQLTDQDIAWLTGKSGVAASPPSESAVKFAEFYKNRQAQVGMARGGHISGPGTGKSDSIPARLSDGEFVMTAAAVRGAGNGDRQKGAAKMYEMMSQFERMA